MKIKGMVSCTQCSMYSDNKCGSDTMQVQLDFNKFGTSIAKHCKEFELSRQTRKKIPLEKALETMLSGHKEFIMISGITGRKLRYLAEKKVSTDKKSEIYWIHCEGPSGVLLYAGTVYLDTQDNTFKFSKGERGKFSRNSVEINSLLFVMNKLKHEIYNIPLTIEDANEFEVERG